MVVAKFNFENFKANVIRNLDKIELQSFDAVNNMFDLEVVAVLDRYLRFKNGLVIYNGSVIEDPNSIAGQVYVLNTNKGFMRYWSISDCIHDLFQNHVAGLRPLEKKDD